MNDILFWVLIAHAWALVGWVVLVLLEKVGGPIEMDGGHFVIIYPFIILYLLTGFYFQVLGESICIWYGAVKNCFSRIRNK